MAYYEIAISADIGKGFTIEDERSLDELARAFVTDGFISTKTIRLSGGTVSTSNPVVIFRESVLTIRPGGGERNKN